MQSDAIPSSVRLHAATSLQDIVIFGLKKQALSSNKDIIVLPKVICISVLHLPNHPLNSK